jgi:hypothetical protein
MDLQSIFRKFDDKIKLHRYQENKELTRRGEIILDHLRANLGVKHTFQPFWQGSYAIGTGVQPVNGDYDIDIGIEFNVYWEEHTAVTVKGWVVDALKNLKPAGHLQPDVRWREPCITVFHQLGNEPKYHVDLAIMAKDPRQDQKWEQDDRRSFIESLDRQFAGTDGEQFRRVIRYLKRWKDVQFPPEGVWAPSGLALTVAASQWFRPAKSGWYQNVEYDDLEATRSLVEAVRANFHRRWDSRTQRNMHRLTLPFRYAPNDDVVLRMSDEQHQQFYQRLEQLSGWLDEARRTRTTVTLRNAFGSDFPQP